MMNTSVLNSRDILTSVHFVHIDILYTLSSDNYCHIRFTGQFLKHILLRQGTGFSEPKISESH